MKRIVLIKEGEYRPNLFADFVETVNRPEAEQVGFFAHHDYTFRLTRNRSTMEPAHPIALAHYNVDVANPVQDHKMFRPIDTEAVFKALDKYDYVMFGTITTSHLVLDQHLLPNSMYIARNKDGKLVNAVTDEVIQPDTDKVTFITTFFGVVRMKGLPVYVIILNSSLTHVTDGFDYHHVPTDTSYIIVTDHDGAIKDAVFAPAIEGAHRVDPILYATDETIIVKMFSFPSVLRDAHPATILANSSFSITTTLEYQIDSSFNIHIHRPSQRPSIHYFSLKFHCGLLFDIASIIEQPTFNYIIVYP